MAFGKTIDPVRDRYQRRQVIEIRHLAFDRIGAGDSNGSACARQGYGHFIHPDQLLTRQF
ncbi:hypothetical protein [Pseudomonas sp. TH10]|uniref:hypothetical protein n=1 Tax=Pseudomonas sp. TH10 TaxID=2796376 RepID=UPI001912B919|nr:hypothetical protein [Pseudomonas sp. TH10]MBK5519659.1 hypothetical protein [Pseudomonas sp. TH10]